VQFPLYKNQMEVLMKHAFFLFIFSLFCTNSYADTIVWQGDVLADGAPSHLIQLELGKEYQIQVSGTMNLGKWWQAGGPLTNDACYEFNDKVPPSRIDSILNSMNIPLSDGKYHPDHVYTSKPFLAAQDGIHFWIHDSKYSDNSGALQVKVIKLD
jgi:hypothetical protein